MTLNEAPPMIEASNAGIQTRTGPAGRLAGQVTHVTYRSPDNRFHVISVLPEGGGMACKAICRGTPVWAGQGVEMTGTWSNDPVHGEQFTASTTEIRTPATETGLKAYLASGAFPKVGKVTADRLVTAFSTDLTRVIEADPSRLAELPGISRKIAERIGKIWQAAKPASREDEIFLRGIGMSTAQMAAIARTHGEEGAKIVRTDPYVLIQSVRGIGFERADRLARGLGLGTEEHVRIRAGLAEAMRAASETSGHCLLPEAELVRRAASLLGVAMPVVAETLRGLEENRLRTVTVDGMTARTLPSLDTQERRVAQRILHMAGKPPPWTVADPDAALHEADAFTGKPLRAGQRKAFFGVLASRVSVVTGGPGVGKTTLLNAVLHALKSARCTPRQAAPTGRAAMNMTDATGLAADTMHMLLGRSEGGDGFRHNKNNPLICDVLVLDEMGMTDITLFAAVIDALPPHAGLILIGDVDQLEPTGPGRPFGDIIDSGRVPVFRLDEIQRQAAGSRIVAACHRVRRGIMPELSEDPAGSDFVFYRVKDAGDIAAKVVDLATSALPSLLGLDPVRDIQVISPMNPRDLGTAHLQGLLQEAIVGTGPKARVKNRWAAFAIGDKVMHAKNNYRIGVRNGELGIVRSLDMQNGLLTVDYGPRTVAYDEEAMDELRLGYCVTVHKMQGSEAPAVIMPVTMAHRFMLRRRLMITAMSRARRMLALVGHVDAMAKAVEDAWTEPRHTQLKGLLRAV